MQCEQLQQRLNDLLDRREDVRSDAEVEAHTATCAACDRLVRAYESMLLGIELLGETELEDQFVHRTVDTADRRRRRTTIARRVLTATSISAAVLIAAGVALWRQDESGGGGTEGSVAAGGFAADGSSFTAPQADSSPEAVANVFRATGRNLATLPATLPETMRRVASHPTTDQIVGPMLPLAEPFGATWEVLLRAWSGGPAPPSAIPKADTGYVHWQEVQHV